MTARCFSERPLYSFGLLMRIGLTSGGQMDGSVAAAGFSTEWMNLPRSRATAM